MPPTANYPPLTPEQQRLVLDNQGFAFKVAWQERGCGLDEDERRSEALFGLILAAQRYDASRGYAFTTFSGYWIRACIWKAATAVNNIVRLDTTEGKRKIEPRLRKLSRRGQDLKDIDAATVAEELAVSVAGVEAVVMRLRARPFDVRLDAVARPPDLVDHADRADEVAEARQLVRAVEAALDRLALDDPRCAAIVRQRIEHQDPPTLAQIGRRYGVSRERMRQLEAKGLARVVGGVQPRGEDPRGADDQAHPQALLLRRGAVAPVGDLEGVAQPGTSTRPGLHRAEADLQPVAEGAHGRGGGAGTGSPCRGRRGAEFWYREGDHGDQDQDQDQDPEDLRSSESCAPLAAPRAPARTEEDHRGLLPGSRRGGVRQGSRQREGQHDPATVDGAARHPIASHVLPTEISFPTADTFFSLLKNPAKHTGVEAGACHRGSAEVMSVTGGGPGVRCLQSPNSPTGRGPVSLELRHEH